jgi:hypothetical protein
MVVIHRGAGFRFVIYVNDHKSAQGRVYRDGEAKVDPGRPEGGPVLDFPAGMSRSDVRRVMAIVTVRRTEFLTRWSALQG